MDIKFLTYTRVAAGTPPKPAQLRQIDAATTGFLSGHVENLLKRVTKDGAAPAARFADHDARELFGRLYRGTSEQFLDAASRLAERLTDSMDGRTPEGLFVALRAELGGSEIVAGVLKLQVVSGPGAVLQRLESGEDQLAAVTDVLEKPGEVEKGALVARSLKDGEVYCADRLAVKARYFPAAFGIRRVASPTAAVKAFFNAAQNVSPALTAQIAAIWPTIAPGYTREVLAQLGEAVPELTPQTQETIIQGLESFSESVAWLDTRRKVRASYKVGGITVSGPIDEMGQHVSVLRQPEGGWHIVLEALAEPAPEYTASATR